MVLGLCKTPYRTYVCAGCGCEPGYHVCVRLYRAHYAHYLELHIHVCVPVFSVNVYCRDRSQALQAIRDRLTTPDAANPSSAELAAEFSADPATFNKVVLVASRGIVCAIDPLSITVLVYMSMRAPVCSVVVGASCLCVRRPQKCREHNEKHLKKPDASAAAAVAAAP